MRRIGPLRPLPPSASPPSSHSVPSCKKSFRVFRVFRGPTLRRPPAARSRAQLYATGDPRSPRHGLESPCHAARAFQPVGLGRAVLSALRQLPDRVRSYTRPAIRGRPDMGWKAHATWHGLSSPWVSDGTYAPPTVLRPQPSVILCRAAARFSESTVHRQRHPNSTRTTNTDNGIAHANPRITTHPSPAPITAKTPYTTVTSK